MMKRSIRLILLALTGACASASAAPLGCLITPRQEADIGTPVVGVVESVAVDRGDRVRQGQVLVVLQSRVEAANVEVASQRARVAAELRAANANLVLADSRYKRSVDLHGRNFISKQALDQAESEFEVARQRVAQAREQLQVLGSEANLAKAQLGQRTLRAPFDGVVVDRMVQPGERVEDRPLLQVAAIDELQVEVVVPAAQFGTIRSGEVATVRPDVPGVAPVQARVNVVDPMVDAASNTFRVRLAVDNREGQVPAGVRCRIDFGGIVPASTRSAWTASGELAGEDRPVVRGTMAQERADNDLPELPHPARRGLTMDMRLPSLKVAE
ncbi:efflux RND transporter periplasmic adaptor subunit [Nitrogeniibacter aestuarii]|uniref:efflux RND transporter periplasmic adaptor subunit n=1 Tax=Nitrogeniibacter aestuarii TaxID=2815343 RepID=UPI001E3B1E50|nr:efflux RND transporter periplasmic adaptor subunit [Nitrogeniibacter aestuarii]